MMMIGKNQIDVIEAIPAVRTDVMNAILAKSTEEVFLGIHVNARLDENITFFFKQGTVIGYAIPRHIDGYWRVGPIYIDPAYRGLGVASTYILDFFKGKLGTAWIESDNVASQRTFLKAGFVKTTGTITGKLGAIYEVWVKKPELRTFQW